MIPGPVDAVLFGVGLVAGYYLVKHIGLTGKPM